jgi:glutamate dehydrogenase (NAD(P)+)
MRSIYTGPVLEMARDQFHVIADYLEIPVDERERLLYPKTLRHGVLPHPR